MALVGGFRRPSFIHILLLMIYIHRGVCLKSGCFRLARAGHVPEPDAWLKPPLYVQNLDELVQLDHNDHDLPRVVPVGEAAAAGAGANAAATGVGAVEKTTAATGPRESEEGGGEHNVERNKGYKNITLRRRVP